MEDLDKSVRIHTLAQFITGQDWRVQLANDRSMPVLVWVTRGQGRVLLDGMRRGIGAHNALFIPAGSLFALDLGRQSIGHVIHFPTASDIALPTMPRQLRMRDVTAQNELTGLIEAALREYQNARPLQADALQGHAGLISVWLRRQILSQDHVPAKRNAAQRLSQRFCTLLSERYASGEKMADYASALGVTPTHLTRAVKASTGRTAADLLTERVLHEARCLLLETKEPAQGIARHLGFGSAAYFTRFIQQHTGYSPSKLRGS